MLKSIAIVVVTEKKKNLLLLVWSDGNITQRCMIDRCLFFYKIHADFFSQILCTYMYVEWNYNTTWFWGLKGVQLSNE